MTNAQITAPGPHLQTGGPGDVPAYAPRPVAPLVRAYSASYIGGGAGIVAYTTESGRAAVPDVIYNVNITPVVRGASAVAVATLARRPTPGNTLVYGIVLPIDLTITPPAGWTLLDQITNTDPLPQSLPGTPIPALKVALLSHVVAAGEDVTTTFTLSASTSQVMCLGGEFKGIITSGALDRTATAQGDDATTATTGTTATTQSTAEYAIALIATTSAPYSLRTPDGWAPIQSSGISGAGGYLYARTVPALNAVVASAALPQRSGVSTFGFAGVVVTLRGTTALERYRRLGEIDGCEGTATAGLYQLGDLQLRIPRTDPLANQIRTQPTILEVYMPDPLGHWVFEQYLVRQVTDPEGTRGEWISIAAQDLRTVVDTLPLKAGTLTSVRGTPPANHSVEDWVRSWVTALAINAAGTDYAVTDLPPAVAVEDTSAHQGTVYSSPPAQEGAPFGKTVTDLLRIDGLGWRVRIRDSGTINGRLEVQIYGGTDRSFGQAGQVVFDEAADTAHAVRRIQSAVGAVDYLIGRGAAGNTGVRAERIAVDEAGRARWGLLVGVADLSNTDGDLQAATAAALADRRPRDGVEVDVQESWTCRLGRDYLLGDDVSAFSRERVRYNGTVTRITLDVGPAAGGRLRTVADQFAPVLPSAGLTGDSVTASAPPGRAIAGPALRLLIDDPRPRTGPAATADPAALRSYTYLAGLTRTASDINSVAPGATANPQQTARPASTAVGTQTVTAAGNPASKAAETVRDTTTGGIAARQDDVQASIDAIVTYLNNTLRTAIGALPALSSTQTAITAVQAGHDAVVGQRNGDLTALGTAGAKVLGN